MKRLIIVSLVGVCACVVRVRDPVMVHDAVVAEEVEVDQQPPAAQVEVVGVAPSVNHLWIPGYWGWLGGRWSWIGGRWELRRAGHEYVAGHWSARHGRWVWTPGHWRRF